MALERPPTERFFETDTPRIATDTLDSVGRDVATQFPKRNISLSH